MKRIISVLLILTLIFSITGCSQKTGAGADKAITPASADQSGTGETSTGDQAGSKETVSASADQGVDKEAAYKAEPASSRTIHIGYDGGLCQAAIPIAQHKGFFEAEGLQTELTKTGGTHDNARDALAAGKIDTTAGMIAGWLKPITNGVDLKFTVGLHTGCASAFVLADSPIQSFADAKGKTIAINGGIGGTYHNIGYRFIAHDGFVPEDFVWKDFPADQTLLILQKGEADVAIFGDQLAEKWVQDGTLRRIRSLHEDEDFKNESCCVLGISGPFLAENPVTSEKISRAIYKASLWIGESDANKEEAAQILLDNGYISGTKEYAVQLMKLFRWGLPNDLTEATLDLSVTDYQKLGVISSSLNPADVKAQIWAPLEIE
jgi:NitT/TauT family transport system substrate-binding protein